MDWTFDSKEDKWEGSLLRKSPKNICYVIIGLRKAGKHTDTIYWNKEDIE